MELRQLRHFLEVYRRASFGQAADALGLTQPALSKSIRNLELELKVALLERGPAGVAPTAYGRLLVDYATLVDNELRRARMEIDAVRGSAKGTLRIGGATSTLRWLMPATLPDFMARYPGVAIQLIEGVKDDLALRLRRGEIDVAVTSAFEDHLAAADLVQEPVLDDRIDVVAARDHPLAQRGGLQLADLAPYQWVIPVAGETERRHLTRCMVEAGLAAPQVAIETNSSALMASLLPKTSYLSYLPARLVERDPGCSGLVRLALTISWPAPRQVAVYRRNGVLLPHARFFINALQRTAVTVEGLPPPATIIASVAAGPATARARKRSATGERRRTQ